MVRCSICGTNGHNARTCKHKGQSANQAGPSSDTHVDVQDVAQDAIEEPRAAALQELRWTMDNAARAKKQRDEANARRRAGRRPADVQVIRS